MDKEKLVEKAVQIAEGVFDKAEDLGEALKKEYMRALENIQKDVANFYAKYASEENLTYADAVRHLSKVELKNWRDKLEEYTRLIDEGDAELLAEIRALDVKGKITRLERLMLDIRTELVKLGTKEDAELHNHLVNTFTDSYIGSYAGIKDEAEARLFFGRLNPVLIEETIKFPWSGSDFSEIIWGNTNKLAKELKSELTQGFIRGSSIQKMSSSLAKRMDNSYRNALRVVRTETAHVLNKATIMSYADMGIKHLEFLAILDGRTSAVCFSLNGDIIPIEEAAPGVNTPPLHPNCRSTVLPVIEDDIESEDGKNGDTSDIMLSRSHNDKSTPMPQERFERIKKSFERNGGVILQNDAVDRILDDVGAEAGTVNSKMIYFRRNPTTSAVYEEMIHATQHRQGRYIQDDDENTILLEIEAQEKLIRYRKAYRIPNSETRITIKNLRDYRNRLKELREG